MRGDRPLTEAMVEQLQWFTPHARGSTLSMAFRLEQTVVYPACAGIDLRTMAGLCFLRGLPRMRGDRPFLL